MAMDVSRADRDGRRGQGGATTCMWCTIDVNGNVGGLDGLQPSVFARELRSATAVQDFSSYKAPNCRRRSLTMGNDAGHSEPPGHACCMVRNEAGVITTVADSIVALLGWSPDQLTGSPSTTLIHPNDQASAVSAWFDMINTPGSTRTWRGRYRTIEGNWRWIEATNTNR